VDSLLANVCKLNVTRFPFELTRLAQDIAGGLIATMPSQKDFDNPEIAPYLEKYLKAREDVPTVDRVKIMRFIENMTIGCGSVPYMTESMHGAGSPQTQRVVISRLANLDEKKELAKRISHIN
jgi:4-hydroxybutyryl-CoA dehydratase/vinylacetyl-CoA-Delta-isomerase